MTPGILTVVTPAASKALADVDEVKAELDITESTYDDVISNFILRASAAIGRHCGRVFEQETVSELFRQESHCIPFRAPGSAAGGLVLARYPVSTVTTITENTDPALDSSLFECDPQTGIVYRLSASTGDRVIWSARKIVVVYQAGYVMPDQDDATLPADLQQACVSLVKSAWLARKRDPLIRQMEVEGVGSETYWVGGLNQQGGLPPDVEQLLAPYVDYRL